MQLKDGTHPELHFLSDELTQRREAREVIADKKRGREEELISDAKSRREKEGWSEWMVSSLHF
jgi:hypothetical protein